MFVKLTKTQVHAAIVAGHELRDYNKGEGKRTETFVDLSGDRTEYTSDEIGKIAEDVFAIRFGLPLKREISRARDHKPGDFYLPPYGWVEVKGVSERRFNFTLETLEPTTWRAGTGALVRPTDELWKYEMLFARRRRIVGNAFYHPMGGKQPSYVCSPDLFVPELTPDIFAQDDEPVPYPERFPGGMAKFKTLTPKTSTGGQEYPTDSNG